MKQHVLLVDDEKEITDMLSQYLAMRGFRTTAADSGHAARRIAQEDPPHLIVTDLQMPDTDGLVLMDAIRRESPTIKVLLLTGMTFPPEVIKENIGKRFDSYLSKTSSLSAIGNEVSRLLST